MNRRAFFATVTAFIGWLCGVRPPTKVLCKPLIWTYCVTLSRSYEYVEVFGPSTPITITNRNA